MKLSEAQLRALIREELTQAGKRKGGGRASLGFAIPEDSWGEEGGSHSDPDGMGQLMELLKKAAEALLDAQELTETMPELKQYQKKVSAAENVVHALLTKVDDDAKGTW